MHAFQFVPIPEQLLSRPKDARGYPIPWNVFVGPDGKPDFRTVDDRKAALAIQLRKCGLCGKPLGRHLAFVGGPKSMQNRYFSDLPMHRACATYAVQVCPFLAAPSFAYRTDTDIQRQQEKLGDAVSLVTMPEVDTLRPDKFGLGITSGYSLIRAEGGSVIFHAKPWESLTWWRQGQQLAE